MPVTGHQYDAALAALTLLTILGIVACAVLVARDERAQRYLAGLAQEIESGEVQL